MSRAVWVTTFVHSALGFTFGVSYRSSRKHSSRLVWLGTPSTICNRLGASYHYWGSLFVDRGKPCLERIRGALFHCAQPEIGGRLAVFPDAQSYGAGSSSFFRIIGNLVSGVAVCTLGTRAVCTRIAFLPEGV
jgi:hypothetical protein